MSRRRADRWLAGFLALAVAVVAVVPLAAAAESEPGAKLPRFVSLRADLVNLRVGPGETYPIQWVLTRKEMPVEIIREFEHWRMIRDSRAEPGVFARLVECRGTWCRIEATEITGWVQRGEVWGVYPDEPVP